MTWLNNIPNIPGLSDSVSAANLMRQNSITNSADHVTPPVNVSQHGSFLINQHFQLPIWDKQDPKV